MIKLIALDLDGTLLNPDKKISEANKLAIHRAREAGVKIVLCTVRTLMGIKAYVDELDLLQAEDYSITYNGGLVQKNKTSEIISQKVLNYGQIVELYDLSKELNIPMNMLDLEFVYEPEYPQGRESLYKSLQSSSLPFVEKKIEDFQEQDAFNKVVFCIAPAVLDEAIAKIPADFYSKYSMMKSRPLLFEVMHPEVDKGNGIAALCDHLGITADEVMACGDEENDLAMLDFAGVSVAMGNAPDKIKERASFITKTNGEDGVAHAIETFVFA